MLPRVCLISTRTFPVISCMAFCAAALAGKSPPSRGENNRGALPAIGKRLPIIDGDLHKVHAMPMLKGGQIGRAHVELQSLMRISYAVFCLKQKNKSKKTKKSHDNKTLI